MAGPDIDESSRWIGLVVQDPDGTQLGRCTRVYADATSGAPEWLVVQPLLGGDSYFVPVQGVRHEEDALVSSWADSIVFTSPTLGTPPALENEDEARLYRHYGLTPPQTGSRQAREEAAQHAATGQAAHRAAVEEGAQPLVGLAPTPAAPGAEAAAQKVQAAPRAPAPERQQAPGLTQARNLLARLPRAGVAAGLGLLAAVAALRRRRRKR